MLGRELSEWTISCGCSIPLEIAGVLMHRDMDDSAKDGKDAIVCFLTLFVLEVSIPERMGEKIETDIIGCAFEESEEYSQRFLYVFAGGARDANKTGGGS